MLGSLRNVTLALHVGGEKRANEVGSIIAAGTRSSCPACVYQIFGAPLTEFTVPAYLAIHIGFVCVSPKEFPVFRRVENVTTSEDRMHDKLSAVRQ